QSSLRELDVEELTLGPLALDDAQKLAAAVGDPKRAEAIANESGGSPFLVQELARGAEALGELWSHRVTSLTESARGLMEVVAVAARPLEVEGLAAAAGVSGDPLRDGLSRLRADRLVRGRENDSDHFIESYHDRIREAVAAALSPER